MNNYWSVFFSLKKSIQLPIFFLLACLLSWWSAPFANGQIIPHGPAIAAGLVVATIAGRQGLSKWGRRVTHWRVAWHWYLVGPAIILLYQGGALIISLVLGASMIAPPQLPSWATILELLLLGGMWEELGWSGYALPKLQAHFARRPSGTIFAVLVLGVLRAIWHLPLYLAGHIPWFDVLVLVMAFQLMVAWLYNRSGGSVPVVILFHFASNLAGAVMHPVFAGADRVLYSALFVALAAVVAVVLARFSGPRLSRPEMPGRRPAREPSLGGPTSNILHWHNTIGI